MKQIEVEDVWDFPDVRRIASALEPIHSPWWIAAGLAIDLFVGETTREHHDADVAILRTAAEAFREGLNSWELGVAIGWTGIPGRSRRILEIWERGTPLPPNAEALWCRPQGQRDFAFELLLNDSDEKTWYFKRDPKITLALERFGRVSYEGVPYLAPEVVLLHKATRTFEAKDSRDFVVALPLMDERQRTWLRDSIAHFDSNHPWIDPLG